VSPPIGRASLQRVDVLSAVTPGASSQTPNRPADDPAAVLVARLDLERYKTTIQGSDAVRRSPAGNRQESGGGRLDQDAAPESWLYEHRAAQVRVQPPAPTTPPASSSAASQAADAGSGGRIGSGVGGSVLFGYRRNTTPNSDPNAQLDPRLRELNAQPRTSGPATTHEGADRVQNVSKTWGELSGIARTPVDVRTTVRH
jgi:hypothetical protein